MERERDRERETQRERDFLALKDLEQEGELVFYVWVCECAGVCV